MIGIIKPNPHLVVRDTGTPKGRGVFTHQEYREGDVVECSPILVINSPWKDLPRDLQLVVYCWEYLCGGKQQSVWGVPLGFGTLINHSRHPNLAYSADQDKRALVYRAVRYIDAGEELTVDYNADSEPGTDGDWFDSLGISPIE